MWVSELHLENVRGFIQTNIQFSKNINVIVGRNNSGKSTILKSLLLLQYPNQMSETDLRKGKTSGLLMINLGGNTEQYFGQSSRVGSSSNKPVTLEIKLPNFERRVYDTTDSQNNRKSHQVAAQEPRNFIYPYLSKRKAASFDETINASNTWAVMDNLTNLYSKIDRISNPQFPAYNEYTQACEEILEFQVTTTSSQKGKKAAYIVNNFDNIPLDSMGEGVVNSLGLIVDLCIADNKLFLIEEPENDIHPQALKALLSLIVKKSQNNQFIITTHIPTSLQNTLAHKRIAKFFVSIWFLAS